jgi:hypothetical protein
MRLRRGKNRAFTNFRNEMEKAGPDKSRRSVVA